MISRKPYLLRAMLEWAEDNGLTPMVSVDATIEGVKVPPNHVKDGRITLNVLYSAMHQREVTNDALTGHARFGGRSEHLYVPMAAISALIVRETGEGMVFPDQLDEAGGEAQAVLNSASKPAPAKRTTGPRAVKAREDKGSAAETSDATSATESPDDEPPRPPRGRPQLTVVK